MAIKYLPIDGEVVSYPWSVVMRGMRKDGVHGNVNEGKRTMSRQWYFWNCMRSGNCNNGNLAAYPSPRAPHIRVGRIDHAIDFGNDAAVFSWLLKNGLRPVRTVAGESWHIECPASTLKGYAKKHGVKPNPFKSLGPVRRKACEKLFYHRIWRAKEARSGKGRNWKRHNRQAERWAKVVLRFARRAKKDSQAQQLLYKAYKDRNGSL